MYPQICALAALRAPAITRAVADNAQSARIPVHMAKAISEIAVVQRRLSRELGREPTPEELAAELGTSSD